ncbi:MAG: KH domain-containing protein [Clostridia bacterium]|nr:KH domain-containing protein [Clostridia bacterium]
MEEKKIITTAEVMELVEYIAKNLVDEPDAVKVELKPNASDVQNAEEAENVSEDVESGDNANVVTIALTVSKDDTGKIIGKQGRIAKAIRTVVRAATVKGNIKYRVDIL